MGHCLGLWHTPTGDEGHNDCNGNPVDDDQCGEWVTVPTASPAAITSKIPRLTWASTLTKFIFRVDACTERCPMGMATLMLPIQPLSCLPHTRIGARKGSTVGQATGCGKLFPRPVFCKIAWSRAITRIPTITTSTPPGHVNVPEHDLDIANTPNGGEVLIDETLTIENGATLTCLCKSSIRRQVNASSTNGRRETLGGTLTAMGCTQTWKGVRVWGSTMRQPNPIPEYERPNCPGQTGRVGRIAY